MRNLALPLSFLSIQLLLLAPVCANVPTTVVEDKNVNKDVQIPSDGNLQAAAIASKAWLEEVDKGKYEKSWEDASAITQRTVSKEEWNKILIKTRKPLGAVKSRDVADVRVATNPKNMPAGEYVVMIYKTSFATKPSAYELVTLASQAGQWRVLTYQID